MGFSDSFKKIAKEIVRGATKIGAKPGYEDRVKSGKLSGAGDFLTFGGLTQSASQVSARTGLFSKGNPLKAGESVIRTDLNAAGRSGNVGALIVDNIRGLGKDDGETPPPVGDGPGVGSRDTRDRQEARRRAIAAAKRRRGSTIATSPLGVQGEGAATGQKRLLGE